MAHQLLQDPLEQLPGPVRVGVVQRGTRQRGDPQVRQLAFAAPQPLLDLAQRMCTAELAEQHRHQLLPAAHPAGVTLGVTPPYGPLEPIPRNEFENLTEQAAESVHVESLCLWVDRCGYQPAYSERLNVLQARGVRFMNAHRLQSAGSLEEDLGGGVICREQIPSAHGWPERPPPRSSSSEPVPAMAPMRSCAPGLIW